MTDTCKQCGKEFEQTGKSRKKYYCSTKCRDRYHWLKQGAKYRNSDKGKATMFAWRLKSVYGITVEQYNEMLNEQGGCCAICGTNEPTGYNWHVDHNHDTGKVRALLCSQCNQAIGMMKEDVSILRRAIEYLEKHN